MPDSVDILLDISFYLFLKIGHQSIPRNRIPFVKIDLKSYHCFCIFNGTMVHTHTINIIKSPIQNKDTFFCIHILSKSPIMYGYVLKRINKMIS